MDTFQEFDQYDGLGLVKELYETAIVRIEAINPKLNAVVTPMYDHARTAIRRGLPDGPFKGVPFLLKDLLTAFAGVPLTGGSSEEKGVKSLIDLSL